MYEYSTAKSDIQDLLVKCVNVRKGCDWQGTVGTLEKHQFQCEFAEVKPKAGEKFCEKCSVMHKEGQPFLYCQREEYKDSRRSKHKVKKKFIIIMILADNITFETLRTDHYCTPSEVQHVFKVHFDTSQKSGADLSHFYGKWMVFKHFNKIDATWVKIRTAIAEARLEGCVSAMCSTIRYNPSRHGPGPNTKGQIGVYTEIDNKDAIGFAMIEITKEDVKYKTNETTWKGKYVSAGDGVVSQQTIYWNKGNPSIEKEGNKFDPFNSNSYEIEDTWHLNLVEAPEPIKSKEFYGHWVLSLKPNELTELWHLLKELIESKEQNYGIIRMECPKKEVRYSQKELAKFKVHTSKEDKEQVGYKLIKLVWRDIVYCYDSRPVGEILYWNDGKPSNKQQAKRN